MAIPDNSDEGRKKRKTFAKFFLVGAVLMVGNLANEWKDGLPANPLATAGQLVGAVVGALVWGLILYGIWIGLKRLFRGKGVKPKSN